MILVTSAILLLIIIAFQRFFAKKDYLVFYAFFSLKILAVFGVYWLYNSYYNGSGDTFIFFENAKAWFALFKSEDINLLEWLCIADKNNHNLKILPPEERSRFFNIILSVLMPLAQGSYLLLSVILTVIAAFCTWLFAQKLILAINIRKWVVYLSILFIPSLLFWSSGILKESLMLAAMSIIGFCYLNLKYSIRLPSVFFLIIASLILWKLKYYVAIVLLPLLLLTHLFSMGSNKLFLQSFPKKLTLYISLLVILCALLAFTHPVFNSGLFFDLVRNSYEQILAADAASNFTFIHFEENVQFVIFNAPFALFTGLFRPFIWEAGSTFVLMASLEQLIFAMSSAYSIYLIFKINFTQKEKWWLIGGIIYIIALTIIITLATPNFGSLARFRVAYMPIAWLINLFLLDKHFSIAK